MFTSCQMSKFLCEFAMRDVPLTGRWFDVAQFTTLSLFFNGSSAPWRPRPPHFSRLHDHTLFGHTTLGRTPLDE
jgi:hypothetical protein